MDVAQPQHVCDQCGVEIPSESSACPQCGEEPAASNGEEEVVTPDGRRISVPSVRNLARWQVLAILFLGVGILGMPILWRNENFTWLQKLGVAVLLVLYTVFVFGTFWYVLVLVSKPLLELVDTF